MPTICRTSRCSRSGWSPGPRESLSCSRGTSGGATPTGAHYLGPIGGVAALIERAVARCADHLIVDSQETFDRLRREGVPAQRMSLLPLGADLELISAVEPSPEHWDVMYAGRLLHHKRVDVLIDALALLRDRGVELRCLIVGSGPEEDRLRRKIDDLRLEEVAVTPAKAEQREVWALMKASKLFAYPSEREGFGLSILEAQACGTTVVTTNHADNHGQYLVADGVTGYLCDSSASGLANALQLALERPARPEALKAHVRGYSSGPRAEQLGECTMPRPGGPVPIELSVVICTNRAPSHLASTLEAIDGQTVRDRLEVIVVDDGAPESLTTVCRRHGAAVVPPPP